MIKIFYFNKRGVQKKDIQKCLSILSKEEIDKYKKYKKNNDAENFVIARFLLRKIISKKFKIKFEEIIFEIGECGKPRLSFPKIKNFDFNISHSNKMIVIAISDQGDVGVDVEEIKDIDFSIIKEFCNKEEECYINHDIDKRLKRFYKIWTLKESYIKAMGKGMYLPMKDFSFGDEGGLIKGDGSKINHNFKTFDFDPDYMLSFCINGRELPSEIYEIKNI